MLSTSGTKKLTEKQVYSLQDVQKHASISDGIWIIIHNRVYDVTPFVKAHPDRLASVAPFAGKEATLAFYGFTHSKYAKNELNKCYIGELNVKISPEVKVDGSVVNTQMDVVFTNTGRNEVANTRGTNQSYQKEIVVEKESRDVDLFGASGGSQKLFGMDEVAKHTDVNGAGIWIVVHNRVYDVTPFVKAHPDRFSSVAPFAGKDATEAFYSFRHSKHAKQQLLQCHIGDLDLSKKYEPPAAIKNSKDTLTSPLFNKWAKPNEEPSLNVGYSAQSSSKYEDLTIRKQSDSIQNTTDLLNSTFLEDSKNLSSLPKFGIDENPSSRVIYKFKLLSIKPLSKCLSLFTFSHSIPDLRIIPFCHFNFICQTKKNGEKIKIYRAYTPISCNSFEIVFAIKNYSQGFMSSYICNLSAGMVVSTTGPIPGKFTFTSTIKNLYFIAAGTGVTPFFQLLKCKLGIESIAFKLLYSVKLIEEIMMKTYLDECCENFPLELEVQYTISQSNQVPVQYHKGRISQELLKSYLKNWTPSKLSPLIICGPIDFSLDIISMLELLGISISSEIVTIL